MDEEVKDSRRDVLKKITRTASFAVPTLVTFHISSLAIPASGDFGSSTGKITVKAEFAD